MHNRYSISQARASLPTIIDRVEGGQAVELTRRGKPVAAVISIQELERLRAGRLSFAEVYQSYLSRYSLTEMGVDDGYFETVRDRAQGRDVDL